MTTDELTTDAYDYVIARALHDGRINEQTARRIRYHVEAKVARMNWPVCKHNVRCGVLQDQQPMCPRCWRERQRDQR